MDSEKIGGLIKDIRNKNNLTQKEFADKYNVTYQAVSKWENGKNLPDITLLHQICNDYNINFSELVGEENKKKINRLYYIIPSLIIVAVTIILFINSNNSFEFKTISTSCKDFEVTGSLAYDANHSSIYISNINYCGKPEDTIYHKLECILYEKNNNIKTEIFKEELNDTSITLEEYLKTISIKVDSYENSCKVYKDNDLYLEIKAYFYNNNMKLFEIPLSLDKTCK